MEDVSELIASGMCSDLLPKTLPNLFEPLESFLEETDKPTELNMIDRHLLALASQAVDEMETTGSSEANLPSDLSFLENVETKMPTDKDDDPLAFLVGGDPVDITAEGLDILEASDVPKVNSFLDDDDDDDESHSDEEISSSESEDASESDDMSDKDNDDSKMDDIEDDGVYGQVSFYDEETASSNLLNVPDVQTTKSKNEAQHKRSMKKLKEGEQNDLKPPRKKHKRKRKRVDSDKDKTHGKVSKSTAGGMRRKNIRSIISEKNLDKDMLSAQNEELERQKRLMELKRSLLLESAALSSVTDTMVPIVSAAARTPALSAGASTTDCKDSQLKSLLQVAEEEAEKGTVSKERKQTDKEIVKIKKEIMDTSPPSDVITLSSDSEHSGFDDDGSDDVVMVPSDEDDDNDDDDDDAEDVNNGGSHINDTLNLPDTEGRVQVNIGHPTEDPDIFLAPQIAQSIKPHQIGGVRFLYDNLVESLERLRTTPGFGCILAHSMGLGKTIQLISFMDIFLRCTGGKRVLCIVPINTLQNWLAEFNYWLPPPDKLHPEDDMTQSRIFPLFVINENMKTTSSRAAVVEKWKNSGGVLVMGYEMFRLLSSKKVAPSRAKNRSKKPRQEVIDVEEEDKNKSLMIDMHSALVDPGPDLVMCDEGHRIKNSGAAISQALKSIKTRRRVVLTGYPLQNNLMEYWCMVDFVRPNFLGTKTEFSNMFERPIMNGQCVDSTASDKKLMRHRSYVLHNLLEGFVQRRGHTVLQVNLPPKLEHVLLVRLSPIQRRMYCEFMKCISESGLCSWANNNPLKAFAVGCKIWNHSDILHDVLTKHTADKDNDLDIDAGDGSGTRKKAISKTASSSSLASSESMPSLTPSASTNSLTSLVSEGGVDKNPITYDWAEPLMKGYVGGMLENSGKFMLMLSLVEECLAVGDKVLIFSQSLLTLNKMEEFMWKMKVPRMEINEYWQRNRTYFRLDGSTSAQDRERLINHFNDPESKVWAFLLSTKAGCLGINLVAANRVIVVDASWNPCHDCQAICRVYRFGQVKKSYVYRLITDNTLEKKIYDRQISKQGMADRIVDDMNPENKLTRRQVENLLDFEDVEFPMLDFSNDSSKYVHDSVMSNVLKKHGHWLTRHPFTHESLLIDRKELRLSKREKRLAKEGYARDKRMKLTNIRPPAAGFFNPFMGVPPYRMPYNSRYNYAAFQRGPFVRPIASVRPMIAAHSQIREEKTKPFGTPPLRPGVSIHQVITTTDILLPGTNTGTQAGANANKIVAGEKIMVIKTPKGVYIRTDDGKMFAVKSKSGSSLDEITRTCIATTTMTTSTTTLTSARGSHNNPNTGMLAPFTIAANNKKNLPFAGSESGKNTRMPPFEHFTSLSSLKSQYMKTGTAGTTELRSSTSVSPIPSLRLPLPTASVGITGSSRAQPIANNAFLMGSDRKMNAGAMQMGAKSKMTSAMPSSLAVRTPRPQPSAQSSTPTASGEGSVDMPVKPVVSMAAKKNRMKNVMGTESSWGIGGGKGMVSLDKKNGVRLLAGMKDPASTSTVQYNMDSSAQGTNSPASNRKQTQSYTPAQTSSSMGVTAAPSNRKNIQQQILPPYTDFITTDKNSTDSGSSFKIHTSSPSSSDGDTNSLGRDLLANALATDRDSLGKNLRISNTRNDSASLGQRYNSSGISPDGDNITEDGSKPQNSNSSYKFNMTNIQGYNPYPSGFDNPYIGSVQGKRPVQNQVPSYLDVNHDFMAFPLSPFSQNSSNNLEDNLQEVSSVFDSSNSSSYQFNSSFGLGIQQHAASFQAPIGSNSPSFDYSSNFVGGECVNTSSSVTQDQSKQGLLRSTFNLQNPAAASLYPIDIPYSDFSTQNPQQKHSVSSSSTSTTSARHEHGLLNLDRSIQSPNPLYTSNTHDKNNFLAVASSRPPSSAHTRVSNSLVKGFRSGISDMQESGSKFLPTNDDSNSSNSLGRSSFNMTKAERFSPAISDHSLGSDRMGDGLLMSHLSSPGVTMSPTPQPMRSKREHGQNRDISDHSRMYYKMNSFSSPNLHEASEDEFGNNSAFDPVSSYDGMALPFSSSTLMTPSDKVAHSQNSLTYPNLVMEASQSIPNAAGPAWSSSSPSLMDRDYNYSPLPSNMGNFPTGALHNKNFIHFVPDPEDNL